MMKRTRQRKGDEPDQRHAARRPAWIAVAPVRPPGPRGSIIGVLVGVGLAAARTSYATAW